LNGKTVVCGTTYLCSIQSIHRVKYTKMLLLSLIFLLLANAVTKRREKSILFNRVAIIILLYSSIVGSNSIIFRSIGSGISIYGGLFLSQLLELIINFINSFSKIGFCNPYHASVV